MLSPRFFRHVIVTLSVASLAGCGGGNLVIPGDDGTGGADEPGGSGGTDGTGGPGGGTGGGGGGGIVTPSATRSTLVVNPEVIQAGGNTATITVTIRDESGNPILGAVVVLEASGQGNLLTQ